MNSLIAFTFLVLAAATTSASLVGYGWGNPLAWGSVGPSGITTGAGTAGPSGVVNGAGAAGPSGIVTGRGAIGPTGPNGIGIAVAAPIIAPAIAAPALIAAPGLGWGAEGLGWGAEGLGWGARGLGWGH